MSILGFDIGSESALIAISKGGGIDIILNEASSRSTPVLVSFQGNQRHVGAAAEPLVRSNYKNTIGDMKRFLGRNYSEASIQEELKDVLVGHKAMPNDEIGFLVKYNDKQEYFTPTQCLAMVLAKLKATVEVTGVKAASVVLSVPIYYTERQRRAVIDAAEIAGLKCQRTLNEPTACAIGYGYPKSAKKQLDIDRPFNVMFTDMGHTDFTVSLVQFYQGKMIVKGVAADRSCGGHDVDKAIVGFLIEEFKKKTKLDCSGNPKSVMSLYRAAEKAKKTLSPYGVDTVAVNCECLFQDRDLACHLDIGTLNRLCEGLIPKIGAAVERCLGNAKMTVKDINDVEMVGGSLRVRWAKEALAKATNRKVDELMSHLNMDEACCRGCALQAAILSPGVHTHDFVIEDYVPYSVNIVWDNEKGEMTTLPLFAKGDKCPDTKKITLDRNKNFSFRAVYDESARTLLSKGSNMILGEFSVTGVPSIIESGGIPQIHIITMMDANGCFKINKVYYMKEIPNIEVKEGEAAPERRGDEEEVVEKGVKKTYIPVSLGLTSRNTGAISSEEMVAFTEKERKIAEQDRELVEKDAKKNELETYVYDMKDKLLEKLKPYVSPSDSDAFLAKLDEIEAWLYTDEASEANLTLFSSKLQTLKRLGDPINLRFYESQERPIVISEFNNAVETVKKFLNKNGIDENYFHLNDDDWSKLRTASKDYKTWIADKVYEQGALPLTSIPIITSATIRAKLSEFQRLTDNIMNKPKPSIPTIPTSL